MAKSSLPPTPTKSGNGAVIGALVVALLVAGGVFAWKLSGDEPEEVPVTTTAPTATQEQEPVAENAPPPPPPPPEETASATAEVTAAKAPNTTGKKAGTSGCSGKCNGTASAAFRSTLRQKAGLAKGCYNKALRQNSGLQGKMTVALRVNPWGRVCSASAVNNSLGNGSVTSCILAKFRSGTYPRPTGGCVDAQVPLNFVSKP